MPDNHFDLVMVYDQLGGNVRVRRGGSVTVVDPATDAPLTVLDELTGISSSTIQSDSSGRVQFIAQQGSVKLLAGGLSTLAISAESATSGAANAAAAQAAQVAAENAQTAAETAATNASSSAGTKVDKNRVAFNVKDYAAVGDGTTNDATALNNALSAALAAGGELYWPPGTYRANSNLPNLHAVRHSGPGVVSFAGALFYVEPKGTLANTLYVATTGSNTNDGSSGRPFLTFQKAFDVLKNYGPTLGGVWTITLAAGTYAGAVFPPELSSSATVTVKGPTVGHPNVPTAVVSSGYNFSGYGIQARSPRCSLTVQDIHFTGYNGSTAASGIQVDSTDRELYTINCHFTDCYWGASAQTAPLDVKGGIFTRCGFLGSSPNTDPIAGRSGFGAGVRTLMLARHSVGLQNAGNLTSGPYFYSCQNAVYGQEACTGHVDFCTIEDCNTGIYLNSSARANIDGTSFKRNLRDLRVLLGSNAYVTANNVFGTGADESGARAVTVSGGQVVDDNRFFTNILQVNGHSLRGLETKFPNQTVTATASTVVYTATLAGGMWRDAVSSLIPRKRIKLSIVGELTGTLGNKRLTVRLGSSLTQVLFAGADVGVYTAEADVYFNDVAQQHMILRAIRHIGNTRLSRTVASNAMTADTNLTVEAQVDVSGDSIAIYSVDATWA